MLDIVVRAFDRVLSAAIHTFLTITTAIERALSGPLEAAGIHGALLTLILMTIPLLMIVAVVKLFGGFIRAIIVIVLALVLLHLLVPLVMGLNAQLR